MLLFFFVARARKPFQIRLCSRLRSGFFVDVTRCVCFLFMRAREKPTRFVCILDCVQVVQRREALLFFAKFLHGLSRERFDMAGVVWTCLQL